MGDIPGDEIWKQIDTCEYLYLQRLFEPHDNSLTIVLEEAISNKINIQSGKKVLASLPEGLNEGDSWPIEHTPACRVFTLSWKNYISYCVTEEMHGSCGEYSDETFEGRLIRVYSKSHFLDFLSKDTGAHFQPFRHYKIACLNHVIDIASEVQPVLELQPRFLLT
jgi:hypothetical protein